MKGDTARTDLVVKAMTIIDGKALSEKVLEEIEKEHSELEKKVGRKAGLAVIIVGENPASQIYVKNKIRACEKVGFHSETIRLDENITEENLLLEIEKLNNNSNIDGILVQLPIPKHIDGLKIINAISAEKDVDGFHTTNIGKMMIGDETGFLPCTPAGVVHMFEEYNINLEGKDVLVIGQSNIVGKPMTLLLIKKRATVQVCNSKTKNLSEKLQKADVVVAAAGSPKLVKAADVKEDVVVIDVGINRVDGKLCGDVDFEEVSKKASFITPVPGGVGPMTIAMLIKNTFKSYKQKIDK
ncbi:MAG: bifunctional methylenetetrahydrofolate dehydrogenase/methenyltetrahydrofolate cyclohydrolase FolD [Leptotrichia hofstadii]